MSETLIGFVVYLLIHASVLIRVLTVADREPSSRAAWVLVLLFIPWAGIIAYLLLGEAWVPRWLRRKGGAASRALASRHRGELPAQDVPERFQPAFRLCERYADAPLAPGNEASLTAGSNDAIDSMVRDFDAAGETIHISFYIWLADENGLKVVSALERAARRGVACRVIADAVGSRALVQSPHWRAMKKAGVALCTSLKVAHGLAIVLGNRVDLRNHRKIVVVDNRITYCGSQNCADPEFRVKAKYAPWVDIMLRFTGPVVRQNQRVFAIDWMVEAGEDLTAIMAAEPPDEPAGDVAAVAFGTGPLRPKGVMSSVFASLLYCAEREVVISTPYFVPDPALLAALVCCGRRGVSVTLILPARNDSWVVGAISKAHYAQLARAGIRLHEYQGGLLHAKTLVVDGAVALVGSANMDRRSLDLNYENNILLHSHQTCAAIRARQDEWLARSAEITAQSAINRPIYRRIGDNIATLFGPIM